MKVTRIIAALLGSISLLLLGACGGGGGGGPTGDTPAARTISGRITCNGQPLPGVVVTITGVGSPQTSTTGLSGEYLFNHLDDGTYTVTPTLSNYSFPVPNKQVTVSANAVAADFSAIKTTYAVYGTVKTQLGKAVAGATVTVKTGGVTAGTDITDVNGSYSIESLATVSYDVTVTDPLGNVLPPQTVTVTPTGVSADFTAAAVPDTYSISGNVTYDNGTPFGNKEMTLVFGTSSGYTGQVLHVTTDATGHYAFSGLIDNGIYGYQVTTALPAGYNAATSTGTGVAGGAQLSISHDALLNLVLSMGTGSIGGGTTPH